MSSNGPMPTPKASFDASSIVRRLAPGLPPVRADSAQIRQVLHNLVQNAQDALEHRKNSAERPVIEVSTEAASDRVRLTVSDNGGGFPEEMMARIFEPYVTTKVKGLGLGLAIARRIVEAHGGTIEAGNRPERGSRFRVTLPLVRPLDG